MLFADEIVPWINDLDKPIMMEFRATPEVPEYTGTGDFVGTVVELPSGLGLIREGAFEQTGMQIFMRAPQHYAGELKRTFKVIDSALLAVSNQEIWGAYVTYVDRIGGVQVGYEDTELITLTATYEIENG